MTDYLDLAVIAALLIALSLLSRWERRHQR